MAQCLAHLVFEIVTMNKSHTGHIYSQPIPLWTQQWMCSAGSFDSTESAETLDFGIWRHYCFLWMFLIKSSTLPIPGVRNPWSENCHLETYACYPFLPEKNENAVTGHVRCFWHIRPFKIWPRFTFTFFFHHSLPSALPSYHTELFPTPFPRKQTLFQLPWPGTYHFLYQEGPATHFWLGKHPSQSRSWCSANLYLIPQPVSCPSLWTYPPLVFCAHTSSISVYYLHDDMSVSPTGLWAPESRHHTFLRTLVPSYSTVYTVVVHNYILNKESKISNRLEIMIWTGADLMPPEAGAIRPAYRQEGHRSVYYLLSFAWIQPFRKDFLCTRPGTLQRLPFTRLTTTFEGVVHSNQTLLTKPRLWLWPQRSRW